MLDTLIFVSPLETVIKYRLLKGDIFYFLNELIIINKI